ncbi:MULTISPECIES: fumarylacetoacetate hydrolase family protein [unclassified Sphingopyxis]|uniref:fumarylacetoacetate hydrolase family protein n=1 Tax=unclassified Sphingopyxis TaxID=2614943 RepID=UPI002858F029|nr:MULTISPECIES: fumarylacetoacetate hydrolase family protein [unclassified Sphingopyxis]MDR6834070.1 2-keto-4-pentenoate hydratase/2-oxohepta-3-ene-1,7-dioic acid hydratase in catechol pathway [Sphingopyxis sp. BE122]MDR7226338.1 2-keto-4-pentenoate hydratase/2-oxohepta-3-ene-1,7-dioic acid hydratase in catechol pathway [Sphingopyxis sp. BE259]
MKLVRFDDGAGSRAGVVVGNTVVDLEPLGFLDLLSVVREGAGALSRITDFAASAASVPLASVRLLAPIERPGKYLAIGMNYRKHVEEGAKLGIAEPKKQLWFNKQTTSITGPFDGIVKPDVSDQIDYEAELGVVIGAAAKHVVAADAAKHIFGYFVANDVSTRDWQFHSQTMTMGKSFDTHGPIGPWIVTADEIADPHDLPIRCFVNGEARQSSNTGMMLHNIYEQIEYLSTAFTLEPGDLIATGTPEGVGIAMDPPVFLKVGDVVRCEIDGVGAIENPVVAEAR